MPCEAPAGVGRWRVYPVSHRNLRSPPLRGAFRARPHSAHSHSTYLPSPPSPKSTRRFYVFPPSLQCPYAVVPEAARPSDGV